MKAMNNENLVTALTNKIREEYSNSEFFKYLQDNALGINNEAFDYSIKLPLSPFLKNRGTSIRWSKDIKVVLHYDGNIGICFDSFFNFDMINDNDYIKKIINSVIPYGKNGVIKDKMLEINKLNSTYAIDSCVYNAWEHKYGIITSKCIISSDFQTYFKYKCLANERICDGITLANTLVKTTKKDLISHIKTEANEAIENYKKKINDLMDSIAKIEDYINYKKTNINNEN